MLLAGVSFGFAKGTPVNHVNDRISTINSEVVSLENFLQREQSVVKLVALRYNSITVTTSCGNTYDVYFPSNWSSIDILNWVMAFDAGNCI